MLKRISTKIISIFALILICLTITIAASAVAVDTQMQHIAITELIAAERINIERVIDVTDAVARTYLAGNEPPIDLEELDGTINASEEMIDGIVDSIRNKSYTLVDGEVYELKFRDEFEYQLFDALDQFEANWIETKSDVDFLIDETNMSDRDSYKIVYESFKQTNPTLLMLSDEFIMLCLIEANAKRELSFYVQIGSILIALVTFILLVRLIVRDFYKPFIEMKSNSNKMGKGKLDIHFKRQMNDEFKTLYDEFNLFIDNLNFIFTLEDKIIMENSIYIILRYIYDNFRVFIPFESISLYYTSLDQKSVITINETELLETESDHMINDFVGKTIVKDKIIMPIEIDDLSLGFIQFCFEEGINIEDRYTNFLMLIKHKISVAFYKGLLTRELLSIVTNSLAQMAEAKDPETGFHLKRMASYSQLIARKLQATLEFETEITDNFIRDIAYAAPMHDIGKVSIKDEILLKPGKLTEEEFEIMKTHASAGGEILDELHKEMSRFNIYYFEMAAQMAWGHHEKFNGQGYPNHLVGKQIPLAARICAISDVFDALSTKRPYKEAFPLEKCYSIIEEGIGTHFDPVIANVFLNSKEEVETIFYNYKE